MLENAETNCERNNKQFLSAAGEQHMRHATRLLIVVAVLCGQASIVGSSPWGNGGAPQATSDNRLRTSLGFVVDYPKRDWQVVVGVGSSVVVFVHKSRQATVAIERTRVEHPLAPNEITDQTAQIEIEDWQLRNPLAHGFKHELTHFSGRVIVIDFNQTGAQGPERVRMYALPRGADWYRVICTATSDSFDKHKDTCQRMARSLTPTR